MGWLPEAEKIPMREGEDPKEAECQASSSSQFGQLLAAISHFVDLFFPNSCQVVRGDFQTTASF